MNQQELKEKYSHKSKPKEWANTDFISATITTFFGAGKLPKMPGTFGSLAAAIVAYPIAIFSSNELHINFIFDKLTLNLNFLIAAIFVFFGAIPFVNKACKDTASKDPGWIVIDEVCGIFMALIFVHSQTITTHWWLLIIAFAIFRFFDILKPLGIHRAENLNGALGVMADDLLGGFYAAIPMCILQIVTSGQ